MYDPASGKPWRPTARFQPENAVKLLGLMQQIHPQLPADQVLNCLAGLMPVQPSDPPLTWERVEAALRALASRFETGQEELPLKTG